MKNIVLSPSVEGDLELRRDDHANTAHATDAARRTATVAPPGGAKPAT